MVSEKRRRELARAKWERQQARRAAAESRARTLRIVGGVAATVVVVVLVGLGVRVLLGDGSPASTTPTDNFPSFKLPTNTGPVITSYLPPSTPSAPTSNTNASPSTPTHPVTTATTGTGTP